MQPPPQPPPAFPQFPPVSTVSFSIPKARVLSGKISCDFCRQRKRRCDQSRPQCAACSSRGISCRYADQPNGEGVENTGKEKKDKLTRKRSGNHIDQLGSSTINHSAFSEDSQDSSASPDFSSSSSSSSTETQRIPRSRIADFDHLSAADQIFHPSSNVRNSIYLKSYFSLINSALYHLLEEEEFYQEWENRAHAMGNGRISPALSLASSASSSSNLAGNSSELQSFLLRSCGCLAIGARIYGDLPYSNLCNSVARESASGLFNSVADLEPGRVIMAYRGLLILSYYSIGIGHKSSVACYLAVCQRLAELPAVKVALPPILIHYANLFHYGLSIVAIASHFGLDYIPAGGYSQQQQENYTLDYWKYLKLKRILFPVDPLDEEFSLFRQYDDGISIESELDRSNLRGEMIGELFKMVQSMGALQPPTCSIYSLMMINMKAETSEFVHGKMLASAIGHKLMCLMLLEYKYQAVNIYNPKRRGRKKTKKNKTEGLSWVRKARGETRQVRKRRMKSTRISSDFC